jgi:nitrogen fixation/metabolism regulation signal transduction histidine kinase
LSLRTRLALVFVAATLVPLGATLWLASILLDQSLRLRPASQLTTLASSLETTGREYYRQVCDELRADAHEGRATAVSLTSSPELQQLATEFRASGEAERFERVGGNLIYLEGQNVWQAPLPVNLTHLATQIAQARDTASRDLRRGVFGAWWLLAALIWLFALALVWWVATRFTRPIVALTAAMRSLAAGNFRIRVERTQSGEIGLATDAFNHTAAELETNRDRLVYLTQLASWQVLARKMAHEVKNSLTPIRLTVEEMVARHDEPDQEDRRAFLTQAASIVTDEIESLERRIRAFSEFSSEPPVCLEELDLPALVEERIAFLRAAHPEVRYAVETAENTPSALADEDLVKGILVNLLENAADAAGAGGQILTKVAAVPSADGTGKVAIEVHDSGPGLSELARKSLFQPTISFKQRGMGLGLSIARKSALLSGGDILLIAGELGGAGFRVLLPTGEHGLSPNSGR